MILMSSSASGVEGIIGLPRRGDVARLHRALIIYDVVDA